jgi:peptide/nickel transport system permease protein
MNALLAISVVNIPFFARSVRGATLVLVRREFIEAAHLSGYGKSRIILSELLPNVLPVIIITMSTTIGWMILETAGLSFLGLGAQPPQADLGSMLGDGRNLVLRAPHVAYLPGLVILVLVIGINLLGDGLRDVLDPRLKSGALSRPVAMTDAAPAAERTADLAPQTGPAPLLAVRDLRTEFRIGEEVYRAVGGVTFDLADGEALGVVGESGSGKSVTALSILGLVSTPPGTIAGGEILFKGQDLVGLPLHDLQDIRGDRAAYIFQDPLSTLNPLMRIGDQIAETLKRHSDLSSDAVEKRVVELLDMVGMPEPAEKAKGYPNELSGGQRQRVVIAIALANRPDLIIADEPTTALDVTTQARVLELLNDLRRQSGAALIFITHDLGVVSELCDRVLVMYAGRIVESGKVADVFERPLHPYTEGLIACVPVLGQPERSLDAIPGLPPPVNRLPDGCAFAPRCPLAEPACREGEIELRELAPGHLARCRRAEELLQRMAG